MEKGDYKNARANLDAAIREEDHNWPAYLARAIISAHEGKWEAALQDCNVACAYRAGDSVPDHRDNFLVCRSHVACRRPSLQ